MGIVINALIWLMLPLHALAASEQSAVTMYALRTSPFYADAQAHRIVGMIAPGTPLQVSGGETNGSRAFALDAWYRQDDPTTLVAAVSRRIVLATITGSHPRLKTLASMKDDYGTAWDHVELSGFVQSSALAPDQDSIWAEGSTLFRARCGSCHALHRPTDFTANQWPAIVKDMTQRAALELEQATLITQYLQNHAKQ